MGVQEPDHMRGFVINFHYRYRGIMSFSRRCVWSTCLCGHTCINKRNNFIFQKISSINATLIAKVSTTYILASCSSRWPHTEHRKGQHYSCNCSESWLQTPLDGPVPELPFFSRTLSTNYCKAISSNPINIIKII